MKYQCPNIYYWIGLKTSHHPIIIFFFILFFMGILLCGLIFTDIEIDPQKLWVSQTSQANYNQIFVGKKFGQYFRMNQMILRKEGDNTDLWQKEYVDKIFKIQQNIISSKIEDLNWSLDDLCYKPISGKDCLITSPTNFWKDDYEKFKNEEDLKNVSKCLQSIEEDTLPCIDKMGMPIQLDAIFGGQGCEGNEKDTDCSICSICNNKTAKALYVTFFLKNDFFTNKFAEKWETEILQKEILDFNKREEKNGLKLYYMLEDSLSDEIEEENKANMTVVIISYSVMFLYIAIMMGDFPSIILSRFLVGIGGMIIVALSIFGALSIVSFFGMNQSLLSLEVVPFLVIAIAVDNMFIITSARDRIAKSEYGKGRPRPNDIQIALALKEVGPNITTAAFCEFFSFLFGAIPDIPELRNFCLFAAFAVLINYFLQMTLFVCCVVLDDLRLENRKYDLLPCLTIPDHKDVVQAERKAKLKTFLSESCFNCILTKPSIIIFSIIYITMTIFSVIALVNLSLGLNQQTTVNKEGELFNYFKTQEKFADIGAPAYIILYNIDYNNETNLKLIDEMSDFLAAQDSVHPPIYSWYKEFSKFMYQSYYRHCNKKYDELISKPFAEQVREFLEINLDSSCCKKDGLCGEPYKSDIVFNDNGEIETTRFRFYHKALKNQEIYIKSIMQANSVTNKYKDQFTLIEGNDKENYFEINGNNVSISAAFPYSSFYTYYDQYLFIRGISLQNILIGLCAIFLVVQIATKFLVSVVVFFFVLSIVLHLGGVLYLVNLIFDYTVDLNAISAFNIIVALVLSVEFGLHIIIFYLKSPFNNKIQKVKDSFRNVGASVFIGTFTTSFIGAIILLFAPSKAFKIYFFIMYFFLIIVGFFHGFVILPLFLSFVNIDKKKIQFDSIKERDKLLLDSLEESKSENLEEEENLKIQ